MKIIRPFFFFILSSLLLLACGQKGSDKDYSAPGAPAPGDSMVEASIGDASGLIPNITSDSPSHEVGGMIYNGLVKYDKNLNLVGDLAEGWDIAPDGLAITFHLRKKVKWHDGHEFSADDVMFTYKLMIDPKTPSAYKGDFELVKRAEVPDKYTFRVHYGKPFAPALASWGMTVLPKHLLEGQDLRTSHLNKKPVGTGPYIFKEWKTGDRIVLAANPHYFEGRPYIDRYIYRIIPDQATTFLELKSGSVDWTGLTPVQYQKQTDSEFFKKNYRKYHYLANAYTYLGFNLTDPRFQDKRVRQALAHAIDKQEIIDGVLLGLGVEATGPYKPGHWAYNPRVKKYEYDPAKAKALLKEAGWVEEGGVMKKNGQPFSFTILTNQGNEARQKIAEIVQRRLNQIGIDVKIRIVEWSSFINEFIKKRRFEAIILGWTLTPDPDQFDIWHSSKTGPDELNHVEYKNPKVDALLIKGRHTFDPKIRKDVYGSLQEILAEDCPYVFLYVPEALPIIHARFKGIDPGPAGIGYNFIKWYVPKEQQKYLQ